jgi:hypothetical protein
MKGAENGTVTHVKRQVFSGRRVGLSKHLRTGIKWSVNGTN